MRSIMAGVLGVAGTLVLAAGTLAQPSPGPGVSTDLEFCEAVSNDVDGCVATLQIWADAGRVPESFTVDVGAEPGVPTPAPALAEEPVVVSGRGSANTAPFDLAGGDYEARIKWGKRHCEPAFDGISLRRTTGTYVTGGELQRSTYIYNVPAGRHYWEIELVSGDCAWRVTLAPVDLE